MPSKTTTLPEIAEDLYAEPLERFIQTRNERVKQARDAGDRELSEQIKQLRKPSVGAWLVNMLVRRLGDEVDQVLELGAELRQAQENLAGDELRALDKKRRQLTTVMTSQARSLARELGHSATDQVAAQVEDTLRAALADPTAAAALRSGALVETLAPSGFAQVDVQGAVGVPDALSGQRAPKKRPTPKTTGSEKEERERARALEALSSAEQDLQDAEERHREAQDAARQAREAREQADEELKDLRARVREAERELTQAKRDEQAAGREQERAERDAESTERALRRARTRLDKLS